ncbi:MAG: DUF1292 domain-containing protein [Acidaminobacteraceae bacterium]
MKDFNNNEVLEEEKIHKNACNNGESKCEDSENCECKSDDHEQGLFITLTIDDGSDLKCQVLGTFDDGVEATYIALMPVDDDTVYLYGFEDHKEEPILRKIDSDKEYDRARDLFLELSK